jgi:hypothetical protein
MSDLSPRERVIVAAVRRGIGQSRIASAWGVSISNVHGWLRAAEKKMGIALERRPPAGRRRIPRANSATIRDRLCEHCGAGFIWVRDSGPHRRGIFCSNACNSASNTKIDPVRSIEARKAGQTWTGIAKLYGATASAVQRSVWLYLRRNDLLTEDTIAAIFRPAPGLHAKSYTTAALRRKFGDVPAHQGASNG